jgi:hypothetical protein
MTPRQVPVVVAVVVCVSLVVTGPLLGIDVTRQSATAFGEGSASVSAVEIQSDRFQVTPGRFGTGVDYVRIPAASVTVDAATGRPRLLYLVSVPALDVDIVTTTLVTGAPRTYELTPGDQGIERGRATNRTYEGTLTVRVQSFTADRTITTRNVTVEVAT